MMRFHKSLMYNLIGHFFNMLLMKTQPACITSVNIELITKATHTIRWRDLIVLKSIRHFTETTLDVHGSQVALALIKLTGS